MPRRIRVEKLFAGRELKDRGRHIHVLSALVCSVDVSRQPVRVDGNNVTAAGRAAANANPSRHGWAMVPSTS